MKTEYNELEWIATKGYNFNKILKYKGECGVRILKGQV